MVLGERICVLILGTRSFVFVFHEDLDFAEVIFDFDEGYFAETADSGDTAGDGDGLMLKSFKVGSDFGDFGVAVGLGWIGIYA